MPTYEYKCENCGHQFDVYQSMKDEKLTTCPNCGKNTLKRLIGTGGGLIFKGTGFYLTDYKNKPAETSSSSTNTKSTETSAKKETATTSETSKKDSKSSSTDSSSSTKTESKPSKEKTDKS